MPSGHDCDLRPGTLTAEIMPVIDLTCTIAGLELGCCIYNASGPRTGSHAALGKIGGSASGAVLKISNVGGQDGNPLPRYKELDMGEEEHHSQSIVRVSQIKALITTVQMRLNSGISNGKPYIVAVRQILS